MTQEQKQLLLKDLCSRLPYGVNIEIDGYYRHVLKGIDGDTISTDRGINYPLRIVKPYLRPISAISEDDVQEIRNVLNNMAIGRRITKYNFQKYCDFVWFTNMQNYECVSEKMMDAVIEYLDEHMFDHRNLIENDLALEAPNDMYQFNKN